jgi:hypothetical protein
MEPRLSRPTFQMAHRHSIGCRSSFDSRQILQMDVGQMPHDSFSEASSCLAKRFFRE